MSTFVLLPGFWLGAWAWRAVAADLRGRGHEVHALSLTGLGERVHLARPDTDLETHVTDVLNLIRYEDLHDVVLVGHSYAGAVVVPSAADRVPDRIARLVFVDSGPLPDGMSQSEFAPPDEQERDAALVGDGWRLPPPPWAELAAGVPGVTAEAVERLVELSVPQPWATATSPVRLTGTWEELPRLHVLCSFGLEQLRAVVGVSPAFRHMAD
ncbi:MAG: alpha/beta fold hydrolase, partial [Umezawaea sp.]